MSDIETDQNLLFGVIALQSDLINTRQFVDACTLWSSDKASSLADILVRHEWLTDEDRRHVEYLLKRRLQKQSGSARQTLATLPVAVKSALASIDDHSIHESLQGLGDDVETIDAFPSTLPARQERVVLKGLHSTGGIGQVWIAHDPILGREIALKELRADKAGSKRNRERFFREAQLTGQLEHPGIVPVYDYHFADDGSRCYYTMRFVKGQTLTEAIRNYHGNRSSTGAGTTAELIRLLNMFVNLCQTIAYAHSREVIHRDLKGDNVIVGDFGEVIVLDWGLAKRLDQTGPEPADEPDPMQTLVPTSEPPETVSATMQGEKLGTPAYMAPEQARGQIDLIDRRTDVYGLAAILYEILVGRPPFRGDSIVDVLDRVIHQRPQSPAEQQPGLPKELERICLKGLSKDRDDRQQSAGQLADQVQSWIAERAERKRTEQERERFFNLSLDLLGILDAEGRLKQTNPAWDSLLGWDNAEINGRPVRDLLHPDDRPHITRDLERILSGESLTAAEYRCLCQDGTYRWVLWNASLIAGESSIYIVGRDITERKQTEQTFRELLESAPDGMVVVSASGQIVMVNAQLERLFEYTRDELLGQPIEILVPEEFRPQHPAHVARFAANPQFRPMGSDLRLSGRRKDGCLFPVEVSLSPVQTEQGLLISCAVRDVSSRDDQHNH
ncbi:PAS domain S-box protein [Maioricimonas sp. JC845]|uniref:PAS domain S-box protein n=1 Tax=Maioricimonas sp. JC845 TaxID=3232138 RepID=UPI00345AA7D9